MSVIQQTFTNPPLDRYGGRIRKTPGLNGGDASIGNTRVAVWTLIQLKKLGRAETDLLSDFPGLEQADLDAAWAYYRDHTVEVEESLREQSQED